MTDSNTETMEIEHDTYEHLVSAVMQKNAEGWFDVTRTDSEQLQARPVDRQGVSPGDEQAAVDSDQWLIREPTGDVYTVSSETFEESFVSNAFRFEEFIVDFSTDPVNLDDIDEDVEVTGWNAVATVTAKIDIRTQSVISLVINSVDLEQDNYRGLDGLPLEVLYDSPQFNKIEDNDSD